MIDEAQFEVLQIKNEGEAIASMLAAIEKKFEGSNVKLVFDDWPVLKLEYKGPKFDGTITPDIAQAIVELQEALNRIYALAVNHTTNLRSLTEEERRSIEVIATVEKGSSLVEVDLGDWAQTLSTALVGKMTGTEIVLTVVGTAVVLTAGWIIKSHLKERSEEKRLALENEGRLTLSQEETRRLDIVTKAMSSNRLLSEAKEISEPARDALLRSAFEAESFTAQGAITISGEEAKKTYRAKRREPLPVQLNGNYTIKSFTWADDFESARVKVAREEDAREFVAELSVASLTADQRTKFKDATFEKMRVYLMVNATVLDDQVTTAKITSVSEQPPASQ